jgi:HAD superfamily hydrolase (TIGR01509 family)
VLWDLDGTLIDSAESHWLAWREVLTPKGYDLTYEEFAASFGQRNDDVLRSYLDPGLPANEIEEIGSIKEAVYRQSILKNGMKLLPGVRDWVERLKAAGWRQAVASSAPLQNIKAILEVTNLRCFEAIVSAEDVERGKPDPQVFLLAANKLQVHPSRCVVVEDTPAGVRAARRASMRVIGVLSSHSKLDADLTTSTLSELAEGIFDKLLAST